MSHNNKKKNNEGEYSYSYIAISTSRDASDLRNIVGQRGILQVYIPAGFYMTLQKARRIARREGRSLSDLVRDLLRDYVRRHEPGNPQLPIDRFLKQKEDHPHQKPAEKIDPLEQARRWLRRLVKDLEVGRPIYLDRKVLAEIIAENPDVKDLPESRRLLELLRRDHPR